MSYTYKKASRKDIDILTKIRIQVLRAANGLSDDVELSLVEQQS